jgi:hypothetical protein
VLAPRIMFITDRTRACNAGVRGFVGVKMNDDNTHRLVIGSGVFQNLGLRFAHGIFISAPSNFWFFRYDI